MSKIITKELFANSYYSIGAGLTLSPMLKNPTISYLYRPFDIVDLKLQQINN
jgi:hypothetical protein